MSDYGWHGWPYLSIPFGVGMILAWRHYAKHHPAPISG